MNHTRGPLEADETIIWAIREDSSPLLAVCEWADIQVTEARDNARLLAAAFTSYDLHCGHRAVECAEGDLLGEALEVCQLVVERFCETENCGCLICTMQDKAKAVLAKAGK